MIEKEITYFYGDNDSEVCKLLHPDSLEKTAALSDTIIDYIKDLAPNKNKSYALINALSAGEYFGPNKNGDFFPEESLKEYHKTFEIFGHVYKQHVNKDPNKAMGKVIFSYYNPEMHRVELIVELDNDKAKDLISDLKSGKLAYSSMGCKVPWDECSICGNRARAREDYCSHLKTQMNQVLPGGRKVFAKNIKPKFFDISIVAIPAERTASVLKLFTELIATNDAEPLKKVAFYIENSYTKTAELTNSAQMYKHIESIDSPEIIDDQKDLAKVILTGRKRIKKETLCKLSEYPISEVLSTFLGLRIFPDPRDFQKLALYSQNLIKEADYLDSENVVFTDNLENTNSVVSEDIMLDKFNEKIASIIIPELDNLAITREHTIVRNLIKMAEDSTVANPLPYDIPVNKTNDDRAYWKQLLADKQPKYQLTAHKNPIVPLGILGGLYYGYAKIFNDVSSSGFRKFMVKNPWLLPVLIGAGTTGSLIAQSASFNKTAATLPSGLDKFVRNSLITFPASYYYSAKKEFKAQNGEPITKTEDFARRHPALIAIGGALAGSKAESLIRSKFGKVANFINELPNEEVNRIYKDLLNR